MLIGNWLTDQSYKYNGDNSLIYEGNLKEVVVLDGIVEVAENKSNKDIPQKTITSSGFKLGTWVGTVRSKYKKDKNINHA